MDFCFGPHPVVIEVFDLGRWVYMEEGVYIWGMENSFRIAFRQENGVEGAYHVIDEFPPEEAKNAPTWKFSAKYRLGAFYQFKLFNRIWQINMRRFYIPTGIRLFKKKYN